MGIGCIFPTMSVFYQAENFTFLEKKFRYPSNVHGSFNPARGVEQAVPERVNGLLIFMT